MFSEKRSARSGHMNTIYASDESTRRAIDSLFVKKSDVKKTLIGMALISAFIGLAVGVYIGMNSTHSYGGNSSVELKINSDTLKVQPQSEQK